MTATFDLRTFVRPWDGKKITEPGIYSGIPMEGAELSYHGDICDGVAVSSSFLRKIVNPKGCLLKAWDEFYLNPDRAPYVPKKHFHFGKALHHLIAGEAEFKRLFAIRPEEFADYRTKAAQAWKEDVLAAKMTPLTMDDLRSLQRCADQLLAHPNVKNGILRGLMEHSIFFKVRVPLGGWPVQPGFEGQFLDVWVKVRPDVISLDSLMVIDPKSCADASATGARKSITDYGYHVQMAMIDEALRAVTRQQFEDFVLLFIESSRPHCINHKPLGTFDLMAGHMMFRVALMKFAHAFHTGHWATYDDDEVPGGLTKWGADNINALIEKSELPEVAPLELAPIVTEAF